PDDTTFQWLAGRPYAPQGAAWDAAVSAWRTLFSDEDATFDREVAIDCNTLEPQITWGTDPSQAVGLSGRVPWAARDGMRGGLAYMGLQGGEALEGRSVARVFIGSCTNARLPDLEAAAAVVRDRKVAPGVTALVVPGSTGVKRAAEARGLDQVF